jgi:hypothetical protein
VTLRGIGGNTNHANSLFLCGVDQGRQTSRISSGDNDSVDLTLEELPERSGVVFTQGTHWAILKLDAKLCHPTGFVEHSAPKLIVEEVDFPG